MDGIGVFHTPLCRMRAQNPLSFQVLITASKAVLNTGGRKSQSGTPFSVSDAIDRSTAELLESDNDEQKFGKRKQELLKPLVRCGFNMECVWSSSPLYRVGLQARL